MRPACGLVALALLLISDPVLTPAQEIARERVAVSCACTDTTGRAFAGALRAAIAHNPRYREVASAAGGSKASVQFSVVSLALGDDSGGQAQATALSVVLLNNGVMIDHLVETCDRAAVEACARSTVATFDSILNAR